MTFHLILDADTPAIAVGKTIIKANERANFREAVDLLTEVRALRAASADHVEQARSDAYTTGYAAGMAQAEAQIETMLTAITRQFEQFSTDRREDIARAAYAAVRAIIGTLDDEELITRLVATSLARIDSEAPVTVEVAPAAADRLADNLGAMAHVTIRANDALGPTDCTLLGPQGRIVASLSVQMDALSERWGVGEGAA